MLDDSKLQTLRKDHQNLIQAQQQLYEDIRRLNDQKLLEVRKVEEKFDLQVDGLNRKLEETKRRLPDIDRQIQKREDEIRREAQRQNR
ncbi:MAG TPA: hypothetical protein VKP88_07610 [Candidatus Paceibacterota bacterium]|nr:hypothetical protein [Candidatus Paceibacterota bacterium]